MLVSEDLASATRRSKNFWLKTLADTRCAPDVYYNCMTQPYCVSKSQSCDRFRRERVYIRQVAEEA